VPAPATLRWRGARKFLHFAGVNTLGVSHIAVRHMLSILVFLHRRLAAPLPARDSSTSAAGKRCFGGCLAHAGGEQSTWKTQEAVEVSILGSFKDPNRWSAPMAR